VSHSAVPHECVRTSRDTSVAATTSVPVVSRSEPGEAAGLVAADFAPSRLPAGTHVTGAAALAARKPHAARGSPLPDQRLVRPGCHFDRCALGLSPATGRI
jgi:hypothetical protein